MKERFLIPAAGLCVVDPATGQPLPAEGKRVRGNDEHWIRRLGEGDVSVRSEPEATVADAPKSKAKQENPK